MKKLICVVACVGLFLFGTDDSAQARQGWYMGLGIPYVTVDGDFDGESGFIGATEVIIVPELDGALGIEFFGGYRGPLGWAGELNVTHSKHDAEWLGASFDAKYLSVSGNFRYFLAEVEAAAQPYLLGGLGYHRLKVVDGAFSGSTIGDAVYSGWGLNLGVGMDFFAHPNFSFGGGLKFQVVSYDRAEGISEDGPLDDNLKGNGLTIFFRTTYHFTGYEPGYN